MDATKIFELGIYDIRVSTGINACQNKEVIPISFQQFVRNKDGLIYGGTMSHQFDDDIFAIILKRAESYRKLAEELWHDPKNKHVTF